MKEITKAVEKATLKGPQDIQLTKEKFTYRWRMWAVQFGDLCDSVEDWNKYDEFLNMVEKLAGERFDAEETSK